MDNARLEKFPSRAATRMWFFDFEMMAAFFSVCSIVLAFVVLFMFRSRARKPLILPDPVSKTPLDIMLMVVDYLEPADVVCLALTSKAAWYHLGDRSNNPELGLPVRPSARIGPLPHGWRFTSSYWRLMLQLEDEKWKCCCACFKLHPVDKFSEQALSERPERRRCTPSEFDGIVYICPCVQLNFEAKNHMVATIRRLELARFGMVRRIDAQSLIFPGWHRCDHTFRQAKVSIVVSPIIDHGRLVYKIEYSIRPGTMSLSTFRHIRGHICPHRTLAEHIRTSKSLPSHYVCPHCETRVFSFSHWRFDVMKWVGESRFPDFFWRRQVHMDYEKAEEVETRRMVTEIVPRTDGN